MRTISVALPTYNRYQFTIDSFSQVINDERISEFVIVDDASTDDSYERLSEYFSGHSKVRILRNLFNRDCYENKMTAISYTSNSWVIILDSDNKIDKSYLDAIYAIPEWDEKTIYQPTFAEPCFNFQEWNGLTITKENVSKYAETNLMTSLNAMNFFINRNEYLKVWDGSVNPGSSDSVYLSLCWLKNNGKIFMTPNLHYYHHIHQDKNNHYSQNAHKYVDFHTQVMNEIKQLR